MSHFSKTQKALITVAVFICILTILGSFILALPTFRVRVVKALFVEGDITVQTKNSEGKINSERKFYYDEEIKLKDVFTQVIFNESYLISNSQGTVKFLESSEIEIASGLIYINVNKPVVLQISNKLVNLNPSYKGIWDYYSNSLFTLEGTGSFNSQNFTSENTVKIISGNLVKENYNRSDISGELRLKNFLNNISKTEVLSSFWTDFKAPEVLKVTPENNSILTNSDLRMYITTEPNATFYIRNLNIGESNESGEFFFRATLKEGTNELNLAVEDELGNRNELVFVYELETAPVSFPR